MAGDLWASELLCKCSINGTFNCKLIGIANETPVIYGSECFLQTGINAIHWPWTQSRIPEPSWMLRQHRSGLELRSYISSQLCCPFTCFSEYEDNQHRPVSNTLLLDNPVPHTALFLPKRANLSTTKSKHETGPSWLCSAVMTRTRQAVLMLGWRDPEKMCLPDTKATFSFSIGRTSAAFKPSFRKEPAKQRKTGKPH